MSSGALLGEKFIPLTTFLSQSDNTTIGYQGSQIYEIFSLASFSFGMLQSQKPNFFLQTPLMPPNLKNLLRGVGVRFEDERAPVKHIQVYQDESIYDKLKHLLPAPWPVLSGYQMGTSGKTAIAIRKDMLPVEHELSFLTGRLSAIPFSWEGIQDRKINRVVTNDWQIHFAMKLLRIPSVLFTGPRIPTDLENIFNVKMEPIWVRDKTRKAVSACPCIKPKFCHDKSGSTLPCMCNLPIDGILEKFSGIVS